MKSLEEVTPDGVSHFLADGAMRASHAKVHRNNIYESMGIPYHRGYREDYEELSETAPKKLSFHLDALSRIISAGNKIRISISCGGSGYQQPDGFPEEMPAVKLYTGAECPSSLMIPVIRPTASFYQSGGETPLLETPWAYTPKADMKNLYVATVPVAKGTFGDRNPQLRNTFDLFINLIYPEGERKNLPCIVNIHVFGGNHHQFERNTEMFLEKGYAVASVDYRLCPPNVWPTSGDDTRGCIRYLKAHA